MVDGEPIYAKSKQLMAFPFSCKGHGNPRTAPPKFLVIEKNAAPWRRGIEESGISVHPSAQGQIVPVAYLCGRQ